MRALDVGIIGCGTAGGAAAIFLSRGGHRVTVYEAVPDPKPVGAGIMLQPTGAVVLGRLGLLGAIVERGERVDSLLCVNARGRRVVDLHYGLVASELYGIGLHRGVLFEQLFAAVQREDVALKLGVKIDGLGRADDGRRSMVADDGASHGPHDLIVVADGARSQLRDDTGLTRRERLYPWGALWLVADDPDRVYRNQLYQVVDGTATMLGLLPTGRGPAGLGEQSRTSMFWSIRADRVDAFRSRGLDAFRRDVLALDPRAEGLVAQVDDVDQLLFARYHDVVLRPWHTADVVYLGDAAHAMSPQLGQGANLALIDAMELVDQLDAHERIRDALAGYTRARRAQLGYYQLMTRWLTPFFQSDLPIGWLRDVGMGLTCRISPLRQQMIRTMCGVKRGILRRSLPTEPLLAALPSGD